MFLTTFVFIYYYYNFFFACLTFLQITWSVPGGAQLNVTKKQMIARMNGAKIGGIIFDIKQMIVRDSFAVAVRVGVQKVGIMFQAVYQFLFVFHDNLIVSIRESADKKSLSEIFALGHLNIA